MFKLPAILPDTSMKTNFQKSVTHHVWITFQKAVNYLGIIPEKVAYYFLLWINPNVIHNLTEMLFCDIHFTNLV